MKSSDKKRISKDEAFDMLLDEFREAFSVSEHRSSCDRETKSFHINSEVMSRDDVTTILYEFSKRYAIEDGMFFVIPGSETAFKIR